eukprot:NODE_123_length_1869_cov_1915.634066_g84_i0.p1 GENE.NODE_123_length_1869_cov_1915.634066_g84_i0~~NODE_123_length_1869_cov_1915.634066_g84_i0.p1  ORF type:complete len:534 (-),score=238.15 NODE_123_length_1869_cov_1915.634066_g84_i0:268-1797(-)
MDPAMEFGGYVEPPTHLGRTSKRRDATGRPAELRTVPDYNYSLFRYSRIALPLILLIFASAAVLIGLTFWQGPYGYKRGPRGAKDGIPRDFEIDNWDDEAGLDRELKALRCTNFVLGTLAVIICVFAIRSRAVPGVMRACLGFSAFLLFALGVISWVSFGIGLNQHTWVRDCPDYTFDAVHQSPVEISLHSPSVQCRRREQVAVAAVVADACQASAALVLCVLLIYSITNANWAWGPGKVPVEKSSNAPRTTFPPPSPFTHIAETRRVYVWSFIALLAIFVVVAFILAMKLHELRIKPRQVDTRNFVTHQPGWPQSNNRTRLAISSFCILLCVASLADMLVFRRRVLSYILAIGFFWVAVGFVVIMAMDTKQVDDAKDPACPSGILPITVNCVYWPYYGTCFVDFWLFFIIMIYVIYEFLFRVFATWDSFYFYADSEWLRNRSLFVEATDREAFDWKKYTMDTGKEYYYSPTLGICTRVRPANYVDPTGLDSFAPQMVPPPLQPAPVFA